MTYTLIPHSVLSHIRKIIDYNWRDEHRHYEEMYGENSSKEPKEKDHIFFDLNEVNNFLESRRL